MREAKRYEDYKGYLLKRAEKAEDEYKKTRALLAVYDAVIAQDDDPTESVVMRVKKQYIALRSVTAVGEWAFKNIPGFATAKSPAATRAREIIVNDSCGDENIDWAVMAIFDENGYYAAKYGCH